MFSYKKIERSPLFSQIFVACHGWLRKMRIATTVFFGRTGLSFNSQNPGIRSQKLLLASVIPDAATTWHNYKVVMYRKKNRNGTWSNNVACEYYIRLVLIPAIIFSIKPYIIINLQMEGSSGTPGPPGHTYYHRKNIVVRKGVFI